MLEFTTIENLLFYRKCCVILQMAFKTWLGQIADVSFNYKYTVFNAAAVLFTSGIQQITTLITFKCPCVDPIQLPENCKNATEHRSIHCMNFLNYFYGMSFIIAPAVGFFVFGLVLKQKLWKAVTGHRYKDKTEKLEKSKYYGTILTAMVKSLIYPATWISAALLDGDFLACALTSMPYDLENSYSNCWNVAQTMKPLTSSAYESNRRFSQTLGWLVASSCIVAGFLLYTIWRYYSPFTFYHYQFYKDYKKNEEEELRKQMKTLAYEEALANVQQFLSHRREGIPKNLWDRISTVYDFPKDERNLNLYSNLHEWAKEEQSQPPPTDRNENIDKRFDLEMNSL